MKGSFLFARTLGLLIISAFVFSFVQPLSAQIQVQIQAQAVPAIAWPSQPQVAQPLLITPYSPTTSPSGEVAQEFDPDESIPVPEFDPDSKDGSLNELWEKLNQRKKETLETGKLISEASKKRAEAQQLEAEITQELAKKVTEVREADLARLKPRIEIDTKKLGLNLSNFPELDGSESCQSLGLLIACRCLDVPYHWTTRNMSHPNNGANAVGNRRFGNLNVQTTSYPASYPGGVTYYSNSNGMLTVPNAEKLDYFGVEPVIGKGANRSAEIVRDYFGRFVGTNGAYSSLIGPAKPRENNDGGDVDEFIPNNRIMNPNLLFPAVDPFSRTLPTASPAIENPNNPAVPADIIIVNRKPTSAEQQMMANAGIELDIRPLGYDALVFITGRRNPSESLKSKELKELYMTAEGFPRGEAGGGGQIFPAFAPPPGPVVPMNVQQDSSAFFWNEHDGPERRILAFDHQHYNGAREILDSLLLGINDGEPRQYSRNMIQWGMMQHSRLPSTQPWTLTYSLLSWEKIAAADYFNTKMLKIDGIAPTWENVMSKKYPYIAPIYVVVRSDADPKGEAVKLRDWLLSEEGQRLVLEAGFIPVVSPGGKK